MAGLCSALLLARRGFQVTLVERDPFQGGSIEAATTWHRDGVPHFLQPHAFIPRGRAELRQHLPDVYAALLRAGSHEVDLRRKLPGPVHPDDEALQYLAVRRPVIEWALRRAVAAQPGVDIRAGAHVSGIELQGGRVRSVQVDGCAVSTDLVVDALGRRSPLQKWLTGNRSQESTSASSDCGVIYYSRYYRQRAGFELPDGPWLLSPRGDLGYLGYATFPGDNGTFAAVLAVPTGVAEWRGFKHESAFETAVATIPSLRAWVDPRGVDPITGVLPMAGLRNTIRDPHPSIAAGVAPVGDALSHTDPVLAHGLSFAIVHAHALVTALTDHVDVTDALAGYAATTMPAARERYRFATDLDEQRHRMWVGEPIDFTRADGDYAVFSVLAAGATALVDADVFRAFVRRIGLLDGTDVLDTDTALQRRIEDHFAKLRAEPRPAGGPTREEMLAIAAR